MEILRAGEIKMLTELSRITGYHNEVFNLRGRLIPILNLVYDEPWEDYDGEILIYLLKKRDRVLGLMVSPLKAFCC